MKIKFLISSHENYHKLTLSRLLNSLINNNIKKDDIFITIGGSSENLSYYLDGIQYKKTVYNSFDLSSIIEVVKNDLFLDYDFVFLLHDTCEAKENFKNLVFSFDYNGIESCRMFQNYPSSNIGLYERAFLITNKKRIIELENKSKTDYVEFEDFIFTLSAKDKLTHYANIPEIIGYENTYSDNTIRQINFCSQLDLLKYKANWEVRDWVLNP